MDIIVFTLWFFALLIAVPSVLYGIEILMSFVRGSKASPGPISTRPEVAVIVPAHNEEAGIRETVLGIIRQMRPNDRLLVVADNCTDSTADIARAAGAIVVERNNDLLRGKGYALDGGLRALESNPPPFVVFIDADCFLDEHALDELVNASSTRKGAVQGVNLMLAPPDADIKMKVAEFAFLIKNKIRPMGLARMGLGCHLTGSAIALPWHLLAKATIANDNLVEDMKLGLDLAEAGSLPTFCETSRVYSFFPHSQTGTSTQRRRWERGHLDLIQNALRRLASPHILMRPKAAFFILDLVIPPLSLLFLILLAANVVTLGVTLALDLPRGPLALTAFALAFFLATTVLAWLAHGLKVLPPRSVLQVLPYILGKVPLYVATLGGEKEFSWIRTDRAKDRNS